MITTNRIALTLAALGSVWISGQWVSAQDALGSGDALDNNLNTISGGRNDTRIGEDYRQRNNVVTGNVVNGRGFRGSVGYSAESDFRQRLGSNDLFQFRADSATSSPELFRLGTTFQQLRFGQDMNVIEYRRSGAGPAPPTVSQGTASPTGSTRFNPSDFNPQQIAETRLRLDRTNLANSSAFSLQALADPKTVGMRYTQNGTPLIFNSSTMRGVTLERADQDVAMIGLTAFDAARIRKDVDAGADAPRLGDPFQTRFAPPEPSKDAALQTENPAPTVKPVIDTNYQKILQSIANRFAETQNIDEPDKDSLGRELDRQYQDLQRRLTGGIRSSHQPGAPAGQADDQTTGHIKQRPTDPLRTGAEVTPTEPGAEPGFEPGRSDDNDDDRRGRDREPSGAVPSRPMSLEEFGIVLRHGERIESLASPGTDRFHEVMDLAQKHLQNGDYFAAERAFDRALRFKPGHPLAVIGMGNAQLGAGLYLSAALTLQNLLTRQPEMIDVTYGEGALPKRERLEVAVKALRERLAQPDDRAALAFLLAYVGRQIGDQPVVAEGLATMEEADPNSALLPLLKQIWLAPPQK